MNLTTDPSASPSLDPIAEREVDSSESLHADRGKMLDLHCMILHRILKTKGSRSTVRLRNQALPIGGRTIEFVTLAKKIYYSRSSRIYGSFDDNSDNYPFQGMLGQYLNLNEEPSTGEIDGIGTESLTEEAFVKFTNRAMDHLQFSIDKASLATGGYVFFVHFSSDHEYLMVMMLNDKAGFAIDQETLDLRDSMYLSMDKIDVAGFVNVSKWRAKKETYLSFTRGKKDISEYFTGFMGCTNRKSAKDASRGLLTALETYIKSKEFTEEQKTDKKEAVYEYCLANLSKGKSLELKTISAIVNEQDPDEFFEYASSEQFSVSATFDGDRDILVHLRKIRYRGKDLNIAFSRRLLGRMVIYEPSTRRLIINEIPDELGRQCEG